MLRLYETRLPVRIPPDPCRPQDPLAPVDHELLWRLPSQAAIEEARQVDILIQGCDNDMEEPALVPEDDSKDDGDEIVAVELPSAKRARTEHKQGGAGEELVM